MATSIIKRSGKKEQYQGYKIEEAVKNAFHSSGTAYNRSIYEEVEAKLSHQDCAHVEEIQDMIDDQKPIEVNCHFCGKHYEFNVDELKNLLKKAVRA